MKKKISMLLIAMSIIGGTTNVFAAANDVVTYDGGGYAIVTEDDQINENSRTGASSKYVYDGSKRAGYWIYGKRDGEVISDMKGYRGYEGKGSVTNGRGHYDSGGWKNPGTFSKGHINWTFSGINKSNYDYQLDT